MLMMNNEIVPDFDKKKNRFLSIRLQKIHEIPGCLVFQMSGHIDKSNKKFFRKQIDKAISMNFIHIILDLAEYHEVSEYGIGTFTGVLKALKIHGGDLVLMRMQPKVYEVYQLLGFSKFFRIRDNIQDAVDSFSLGAEAEGPFPKVLNCLICGKKLRAEKPGRFRCAECKTILAIDETGQVKIG